ncbi:sensor histidine kinase [Prauserella muralis]|uniref:histidine kinase n=1 Tax=Prauserella muralis TaxID=588067 RepID=A0A2V4B290_9PSEU|nr:nitrate- and nitrite sensing domain-containing protein [Prauserella muralis]PXY22675.1 hypothetical protein BAY60_22935 [Prauserella muralis]TWE28388.1 signal transduction histidine kinase [Prauserella muralis]
MSVRHGMHAAYSQPRALVRRLRPRSVRAKIVALLMVPVVSLMVLWALATVSAVQNAWTTRQAAELGDGLATPVAGVVTALQQERAIAARHLARSDGGDRAELEQRQVRSDTALRSLADATAVASADIASLAADVGTRVDTLTQSVQRLREERTAVLNQRADWRATYDAYTGTIQDAFAVQRALADAQGGGSALPAVLLGQIGEQLAQQDAIATAAEAAGRMSAEQQQAFATAVGGQRTLTANLLPDLAEPQRAAYQRLLEGDPYRSLAGLQAGVVADPSGRAAPDAVAGGRWGSAIDPVTRDVAAIGTAQAATAAAETAAASRSALTQGGVTVVLGLLAVLLALVISVRIGRGLVVELVGLRNSALELANRRLPQAMRRLRAGEKIDVDADVPVVPPGEGEVGQVGDALNAVQRAAIKAAAERAELLTGVSGVFVTLARRSQSLVHRQLSLLDTMERRTEDPSELEDLFRLDHLAARMRRHAEGLIIMSGAAPGRTWNKPVPLMTAVRSAVAEVEEFQRVEVRRMPDVAVRGSAVADLTHMIAELVENATSFSPPNTTVLVHGEPVGAGFVVEIEDRGLGMRPETMAEANRRIAEAHQLDLFASDQLGFFVISRLAHRQNITVTLRRSAYGGTTAVLLLPSSILTHDEAIESSGELYPAVPATTTARAQVTRRPEAMTGTLVLPEQAPPRSAEPIRQQAPAPRPERPSAPPPPPPPPVADPHDDITGGLPRRTRQASLAPGLRGEPGDDAPTPGAAPQASPEQARATMSALQQGFTRGRHD